MGKNQDSGSYFLELRKTIFLLEFHGWKKFESGMEKNSVLG
jgi:hypothetical protein